MRKILLVPDSFKGTMRSDEICGIMSKAIKRHMPRAAVVEIPVADGGEGSVDCFLTAVGGEKKHVTVKGVFGEPTRAYYGLLPDGKTAVIEMAACAGLPLAEGRLNPLAATTYGVGELMLSAVADGATRLIVGLGGSATNDGGCGAAAAAGIRFFDMHGEAFVPTGGTLKNIARIDASGLSAALSGAAIVAMCDIDNPMYGKNGAAFVFAPQKGADAAMVEELDAGLRRLAAVCRHDLGVDLSEMKGAGAAGAMGAGMVAFFGASLQMGIQTVLDTVGFDSALEDADLVITGEGRIDWQSMGGKVVAGVAERAAARNVPVLAVVGGIGDGAELAYDKGVTAIFSINTNAVDFSRSRDHSGENLAITMDNIIRFAKALSK